MNDKQIVEYARFVIASNLEKREHMRDAMMVMTSDAILYEHIIGLTELFNNAREILEESSEMIESEDSNE